MRRLLVLTALVASAAGAGCADNRANRTAACNPCAPVAAPACGPACAPAVGTEVYAPAIGGVQMMPGQVVTPSPEVYTPAPQ